MSQEEIKENVELILLGLNSNSESTYMMACKSIPLLPDPSEIEYDLVFQIYNALMDTIPTGHFKSISVNNLPDTIKNGDSPIYNNDDILSLKECEFIQRFSNVALSKIQQERRKAHFDKLQNP
jgi:hypothetical protein